MEVKELEEACKETTPGSISMENYLVIANVSKRPNVVQLIHTAASYNFIPILVGVAKIKETLSKYLKIKDYPMIWMDDIYQLHAFLKEKQIPLIGIEILERAHSVLEYTFPKSVAIMPGNEGSGLNHKQIDLSDEFVYIPQYGHGTASLNVFVATTVVLHRYALQHFLS
jgi:tRNA G18 (ribose-2'-O)-methylase SpoU